MLEPPPVVSMKMATGKNKLEKYLESEGAPVPNKEYQDKELELDLGKSQFIDMNNDGKKVRNTGNLVAKYNTYWKTRQRIYLQLIVGNHFQQYDEKIQKNVNATLDGITNNIFEEVIGPLQGIEKQNDYEECFKGITKEIFIKAIVTKLLKNKKEFVVANKIANFKKKEKKQLEDEKNKKRRALHGNKPIVMRNNSKVQNDNKGAKGKIRTQVELNAGVNRDKVLSKKLTRRDSNLSLGLSLRRGLSNTSIDSIRKAELENNPKQEQRNYDKPWQFNTIVNKDIDNNLIKESMKDYDPRRNITLQTMKKVYDDFKEKVDQARSKAREFLNYQYGGKRADDKLLNAEKNSKKSKLFSYFKKIFPQLNESNFQNQSNLEFSLRNKDSTENQESKEEKHKKLEIMLHKTKLNLDKKYNGIFNKELFASPQFAEHILDEDHIEKEQLKQNFNDLIKNCNKAVEEYAKFKLQEFKDKRLKIDPIPYYDQEELYDKYAKDKYAFLFEPKKTEHMHSESHIRASRIKSPINKSQEYRKSIRSRKNAKDYNIDKAKESQGFQSKRSVFLKNVDYNNLNKTLDERTPQNFKQNMGKHTNIATSFRKFAYQGTFRDEKSGFDIEINSPSSEDKKVKRNASSASSDYENDDSSSPFKKRMKHVDHRRALFIENVEGGENQKNEGSEPMSQNLITMLYADFMPLINQAKVNLKERKDNLKIKEEEYSYEENSSQSLEIKEPVIKILRTSVPLKKDSILKTFAKTKTRKSNDNLFKKNLHPIKNRNSIWNPTSSKTFDIKEHHGDECESISSKKKVMKSKFQNFDLSQDNPIINNSKESTNKRGDMSSIGSDARNNTIDPPIQSKLKSISKFRISNSVPKEESNRINKSPDFINKKNKEGDTSSFKTSLFFKKKYKIQKNEKHKHFFEDESKDDRTEEERFREKLLESRKKTETIKKEKMEKESKYRRRNDKFERDRKTASEIDEYRGAMHGILQNEDGYGLGYEPGFSHEIVRKIIVLKEENKKSINAVNNDDNFSDMNALDLEDYMKKLNKTEIISRKIKTKVFYDKIREGDKRIDKNSAQMQERLNVIKKTYNDQIAYKQKYEKLDEISREITSIRKRIK